MSIRETRREAALERMADHVLEHGLRGASLRPLAAAAGTSNRMLLYYFRDKEELLGAVLTRVAERLTGVLAAMGTEPQTWPELLAGLAGLLRREESRPYMHLWLELAAAASRGEEPFRTIAGSICDGFLAWGASRLKVDDPAQRPSQAALLLGTVDGLLLLDAVGRGSAADAALQAVQGRTPAVPKGPQRRSRR